MDEKKSREEELNEFFDNLGPTYSEVMRSGEKTWEREKDGRVAQIWAYDSEEYAMVWDKKTGENLMYTNYKNVLREKEERKNNMPKFEVYEDNAGGLTMFALNKEKKPVWGRGEYQMTPDDLCKDIYALVDGADPVADGWDNSFDVLEAYEQFSNGDPSGVRLVADSDGIYYDLMGSSASLAFSCPRPAFGDVEKYFFVSDKTKKAGMIGYARLDYNFDDEIRPLWNYIGPIDYSPTGVEKEADGVIKALSLPMGGPLRSLEGLQELCYENDDIARIETNPMLYGFTINKGDHTYLLRLCPKEFGTDAPAMYLFCYKTKELERAFSKDRKERSFGNDAR